MVVERFEVFLELEWGIKLVLLARIPISSFNIGHTNLRKRNQRRAECHVGGLGTRADTARWALILTGGTP